MFNKESLSIAEDTQEFFYSTLEEAVESRKILLSPTLLNYLSSVLAYYSLSQNLCQEESLHRALLKKYIQSLSAKTPSKNLLLKQVAEESLYTLGFFTAFFKKKIIGLEYYTNLGSNAYKRLSKLEAEEEKKDLFLYCGENFLVFLELFRYVSKNCLNFSPFLKK